MTSRRFLLSVGPAVVASFTSRPVMSSTGADCRSASSFASMNPNIATSREPNGRLQCSAYNVEYWRKQLEFSPPWAILPVSGLLSVTGSSFDAKTVREVLEQPIAMSGQLGVLQHVLAMLLALTYHNVGLGAFNPTYLSKVWSSYAVTGTYSPAPGSQWTDVQIVQWLRYLMYPVA